MSNFLKKKDEGYTYTLVENWNGCSGTSIALFVHVPLTIMDKKENEQAKPHKDSS